jgi:hypothetical protein
MIYLLDANTLIDAKRDYFQFERVPEFWEWIAHKGSEGVIKIPIEIYEEFESAKKSDGTRDELAEWAARIEIREALLLEEDAEPGLVQHVTYEGYAADLSDDEIVKLGRDPFLISYAMFDPVERAIVTTETAKPSKKRANRKIPDVCADLEITCINNFDLLRVLDFRTGWRA